MKAVLFDLDGTLLNSLADIADAANHALVDHGFDTHPTEAYNYFVGDGLFTLMKRILPKDIDRETFELCCERFHFHYKDLWNKKTCLYSGISQMLVSLQHKKIPLGILSNKPDIFTQKIVKHYFDNNIFSFVSGQKEGVQKKPAPDGALLAAEALALSPNDIIFVGDTSVDIMTGKNSGMFTIGVSWGFRPVEELRNHGADLIVNDPKEIVDYVFTTN